ncbi:hypothetical protein BC939DRAFT_453557 [Gamsiella multidivaricata]|uniref:uncharacterized protein n=1 Tax=Gamsiella multidivaricata TaxID=101098 RepID=UPI0022209EF8|nr:uncharacterized protein BC939DRAFT_453557 [Gamsiella multidivaricata]KAI7822527.1 hypothetical protein BC939DRAFT_453557 [Gamsiella multidivaricata]
MRIATLTLAVAISAAFLASAAPASNAFKIVVGADKVASEGPFPNHPGPPGIPPVEEYSGPEAAALMNLANPPTEEK